MTSSKSTKRALLSSALAILMCVAMLVGTTFAWFTDTASTAVNKIQSGILDVDIVDENNASLDGKSLSFKNIDGDTDILWEPGATFELDSFKIVNDGNLALKYKVIISGVEGSTKLLEAIDFTVKNGDSEAVKLDDWYGVLLPKGAEPITDADIQESKLITISGHMKEDAGNDYQNKSIDGIGITVVATQYTYENDIKDNSYDASAEYPVADLSELNAAFAVGGIIAVNKDITVSNTDDLASRTIIAQPTTLNLDKKIISPDNMGNNNTNFVAVVVDADTTINAGENGGIDTGNNGAYALNIRKDATLTINGGTYYGGGTAVQVQAGHLVINGGFFAVEPFEGSYGYNFLLNCIDSNYKNGTASITVYGGTFVNFDPSDNKAEGANTNFVADGYKVVSETKDNGDIWYTVVAE